ncbi:MAG: copper-binding protein [Gammaproteobacteria bacterium]
MKYIQYVATCCTSLLLGLVSGLPGAAIGAPPDPADASAVVPATVYRSVFENADLRPDQKLPWKKLFREDSSFVPEDRLGGDTETESAPITKDAQPGSMQAIEASDAEAVIKSIDKEAGKVKLKHGPIAKFDMPGMTMIFRVADPMLLDKVKEGEQVRITVEQQGNAFVVTDFRSPRADESDARGVVKAIDRKAGKIKLKHGPIDKFEMPGMTMMFRVQDPSLLDQVQEGDDVGFTVEQQGNAYVVTGFQR